MNKEIEILIDGKPTKMKLPTDMQDSKIVIENGKVFAEVGVVDYINNLKFENQELKDLLIEKDNQIEEIKQQKTDYTKVNILEIENQRLTTEESKKFMDSTKKMVTKINDAFKKQLSNLYQSDMIDTDAEMKVFESMLQSDGFDQDNDFKIK